MVVAAWSPGPVEADARSDYLIRLLRTSSTFRVRAQAAISLGRVDASESVVGALSEALRDQHPAVRTAAASSLERLADPDALPALQRASRDRVASVRRAVGSAIRTLRRVARTRPRQEQAPARQRDARYYVGVGVPGTKQARLSHDMLRDAHSFLRRQISEMEGVELAPDREANGAARRIIRQRGLTGYYIDSSIVSLGASGGGTRAVVSVIVGTYPGRDMRAILQGAATVPGARGQAAEEQALQGALRGALRRLPQALSASAHR